MNKYRVILEGRNFLLDANGEIQKYGFYATRYVEASTPDEAERNAVQTIRGDSLLTDSVMNENADPPMIYLDSLDVLSSFDGVNAPGNGYSFYMDEGREEDSHNNRYFLFD